MAKSGAVAPTGEGRSRITLALHPGYRPAPIFPRSRSGPLTIRLPLGVKSTDFAGGSDGGTLAARGRFLLCDSRLATLNWAGVAGRRRPCGEWGRRECRTRSGSPAGGVWIHSGAQRILHRHRHRFFAWLMAPIMAARPAARRGRHRCRNRRRPMCLRSRSSTSTRSPGLALTLGILCFAVVTAIMLVRTRPPPGRDRSRRGATRRSPPARRPGPTAPICACSSPSPQVVICLVHHRRGARAHRRSQPGHRHGRRPTMCWCSAAGSSPIRARR